MSDKQSNLTDKEMEDLQSIVTDTLASVCTMSDKHNIDRDSMLKYFADMLTAFAELASIHNYETSHTCNCQHNNNSRDNEPCCRCDSRKEKREVKIVTVSDLIKLQSRSRIGENMEDRCLFKAKRLDNGEWVTGSLITCEDGTCKIATSCLEGKANEPILVCAYDVYRDTICQCTGLKDKNGKLICENDIINNKCGGKAVVVWDKAEWRIKWIKDIMWRRDLYFWVNERQCEVIGNKIDNPELLESERNNETD